MTRSITYTKPLGQDREKYLFYLACRNKHRESKKMKKQRHMLQAKEQDKTPNTDLNETEISDLPDTELKIQS